MFPLEPLPAAIKAVQLARKGKGVPFEDGPVGDMVRDALSEGLPEWGAARSGYLYLACNPAAPDLYKIGRTKESVEQRMKTLNGPGVLVPWRAVLSWKVYDAPGLEALAHTACAEFRVKGEMFQAPWQELAARIEAVLAEDTRRLRAELGAFDLEGELLTAVRIE